MLGIRNAVDVLAGTLVVLAASWSAGCGKSAAANPDGGDGSLTIPDAPLTGARAFDVLAVLRGDGSTSLPPNHRFTLVLDVERKLAIVGGLGSAAVIGVTSNDGRTFRSAGKFRAGVDLTTCNGPNAVNYDNFEVTVTEGGLTGTADGSAEVSCGDCSFFVPFSATLTGAADATPPTLRGTRATPATPFEPVSVVTSEPLPVGATAQLVGDDGSTVDLVPTIVDGIEPLVVGFTKPQVALRAGQGYAVTAGGLVDFAGQTDRTGPPLRLAAFPAADLAPEDGFESTTGGALGGAMVVTTGGPLPPIAGNTSLYIGNKGAPALDSSTERTLTVRLARQAGDTRLRFSYRVVAARSQASYVGAARVGVEGGSLGAAASLGNGQAVTEAITVAGQPAYAGPLSVLELDLPADATDQVLLVVGSGTEIFCGLPRFGSGGLLIDDLRLE